MGKSTRLEEPTIRPLQPQDDTRPYSWPGSGTTDCPELTEAQTAAARRVLGLLGGMATEKWTPASENAGRFDFLPVIQARRTNNVILIDGRRGSGKTSLMATLLDELNRAWQNPGQCSDIPNFEGRGRIVPVAFLDLNPLPGSANLLLHLVGALEEVVRSLERRPDADWRGPDEPPWMAMAAPRPSAARDRWMELNRAAATAWQGNLEQRAPNIDPEVYSFELSEAEKDRRELSQIFRRFIDALCQEALAESQSRNGAWAKALPSGEPLFLIGLDDADLVPDRAVEVLDLLRKLWHPRVAFLLTADSDLLLVLLRNRFLGMLLQSLSGRDLPGKQWQVQDEVAQAMVLATTALERIIPPAHRCRIADLSHDDKLSRLRDPLKALVVRGGRAPQATASSAWPTSLYDYFDGEKNASAALPSQIRSLRTLERELMDIMSMRDSGGEPSLAPQIAQFIAHLWEDLLDREPLLSDVRDLLRRVVRVNEAGQLVVERGDLVCRINARRARLVPYRDWTLGIMSNHVLSISLPGSPLVLSDALRGAFRVACDLVADIESFQFSHASPAPDGYQLEPVNVKWDHVHDEGMRRGFTWPLPDWEEFLSFSSFVTVWDEQVVKSFPQPCQSDDLARLARKFLALVIQVAKTRSAKIDPMMPDRDWSDLARDVATLADASGGTATERDRRNADWALGRAGLLAAPEGGLPAKHANEWLAQLKNAFSGSGLRSRRSGLPNWPKARENLSAERFRQIRRRWDGKAEPIPEIIMPILAAIDRGSAGHLWRRLVEAPIAAADRASRSRFAAPARKTGKKPGVPRRRREFPGGTEGAPS
jgi:hypothetical protein